MPTTADDYKQVAELNPLPTVGPVYRLGLQFGSNSHKVTDATSVLGDGSKNVTRYGNILVVIVSGVNLV